MGGIDRQSYTNDAFVLDTRSEQIETVLEQQVASKRLLRFASVSNASITAAENVVVALVMGDDFQPYLIQYNLDTNALSIVQSLFP